MNIRVFSFHRISEEIDELWQPMHPHKFARILEYIVENYKVVDLDTFLLSDRPEPADRPYAGITFDDGYRDILTQALPIMQEYDLPYNVFVVTNCVDTGIPPWTYVLDYKFMHTSVTKNGVLDLLPPEFQQPVWADRRSKVEYAKRLKPFLKNCANEYREKIVKAFSENFNDISLPANLLLNWDEINYLQSEGANIGSHSHTHPLLGKMEQESSIVSEFKTSFDILTAKTGKEPVSISYPVGSVDERVKRIAKDTGYKLGFAVNQADYESEHNDLFEIPRLELYNETMFKTKLRANGVIQSVKKYFSIHSPSTH